MATWILKVYISENCGCSTVACSDCKQPALEPTYYGGFDDGMTDRDRYFKWDHSKTTSNSCLSKFCPHCGAQMTGVDLNTEIYHKDYEADRKAIQEAKEKGEWWRFM